MNLEITNDNIHLLIPSKVALVCSIYAQEHNSDYLDAIKNFYMSKLYQNLENEETKLWHLGPVALYQMWEEEKQKKN